MAIGIVGKLIYMAVVAAVSYLAAYLLAPKPPETPLDDSKTSPSVRGTLLPNLLGHFRIMGIMGYVGGRVVTDEKVDGGGKGGGDDPTQKVYHEKGWHQLSFGQGRNMVRIFQAGKIIWEGDINPTNTPSGSVVDTGTEGRFQIYWGEDTQPLCTSLETAIGVSSKWPNVFYIFWDTKRLGTTAVWPVIEYEVTVDVRKPVPVITGTTFYEEYSFTELALTGQVFVDSYVVATGFGSGFIKNPYTIRVAGATTLSDLEVGMRVSIPSLGVFSEATSITTDASYTYVGINVAITFGMIAGLPVPPSGPSVYREWLDIDGDLNVYGWPYWGANPASSIEQFVHQPRPWGAGLSPALFDNSLQDVHDLLDAEETPCTSLIKSGRSWRDGIASILQDMGVVFYFDQDTGLYGFKSIRTEAVSQTITQSEFDGKSLIESFGYSVLTSESRIFSFKDSARKFSDSTILSTDDASARYSDDPNAKKVPLETITSFPAATRAAARREQELMVDGVMSADVAYGVYVRAGDLVQLEGLTKNYRVASVKTDPDEAKKTVGFIEDAYSPSSGFIEQTPSGMNPANRLTVAPDLAVRIIETNRFTSPNQNGYHVLRIRLNQVASSGLIYDSSDGSSYANNGEMVSSTGGELTETIIEGGGGILETGPEFTLLGEDTYKIQDLSSLENEWRSGTQLCLIGAELFFLRNVTAISGTTYRLDGLIRARYGTVQSAHAVDDIMYIFQASSLVLFNEPWIEAGASIFVKAVPVSATSSIAIEDILSTRIIPYLGGGYRPLPPENLNTTNNAYAWLLGTDAVLRWDYKNAMSQSGAGMGLSDEIAQLALPEGYFKITILNGTTIVREELEILSNTFTYTQAMMATDFGVEPSTFNVEVVEILNGLTSEADTATITRV